MLFFLPAIVQLLLGAALLGAGIATHIVILGVVGALGIVWGGYRWLRGRRDGAAR